MLCFLALSGILYAQCEYQPTPKVAKLLEQSKDKKYSSDERFQMLENALEEDPACLPCLMRLGELSFLRAKHSGASFSRAWTYFNQLTEICDKWHSEQFYFMGAMAYADMKYSEAENYFQQFLRFPDDDPSKFEKDYDKKYAEVEEALVSVARYKEIYEHNISYNPVRVSGVSSDLDDYLPCITPDGEIMFYTRKILKQAKGDIMTREIEQMTWSRRADINQPFDNGEPLPPPFNVGVSNYGGATVSADNREFIFARKNPVAGNPENIDLFTTRYEYIGEDGGRRIYQWTEPTPLESINTEKGWESQPSLSGDGRYLFFATVRPEVMKTAEAKEIDWKSDIFFSERTPEGTWGSPKTLGPVINTTGAEKGPYMHSDSRTLYFASTGHFGVGGFDLYYARMNDDGSWSEPKNLGAPINTDQDELGIIVSADGEVAYFGAKNFMKTAGYNVYSFEMPAHARPDKVVLLKGEVRTDSGEPASDAAIELKYKESKKIETIKVNRDDGSYAAIVNVSKKQDVVMSVKGENVSFNARKVVSAADPDNLAVVKTDIRVEELSVNKAFLIPDINYATNKAEILPASSAVLDEFVAYLQEHPGLRIEIRGHTDSVGDDKSNLALSAERAFEVMNYLSTQGIQGSRMSYAGYGETAPVAGNDTEEGRAKNRRTEFVVKGM